MFRRAASKVMWVGRATVFLVGLAVVFALVFGAAATALAGTGVGATFNLGQTNTVNTVSQLVGSTAGALLKIDNNGAGPALNLITEPGKTPMWVSSSTKVANLNADQLDGKDSTAFMPLKTYQRSGSSVVGQPNQESFAIAYCDPGDEALSGSYSLTPYTDYDPIRYSWVAKGVVDPEYYIISWYSDGTPTSGFAMVTCVDTTP